MHVFTFRERELAAVKINAADVDIIANELEVYTCSEQGPFNKVLTMTRINLHLSICEGNITIL